MEGLLSPCTRCRDIVESQGDLIENPCLFEELNLDISTEDLLSAERAFTYADLYTTLGNGNKIVWLTTHAFVARKGGIAMYAWMRLDDSCRLCFSADGEEIIALARSPQHLLEICDVVLRLLPVSVVQSVILKKWNYADGAMINAIRLAYLMQQCQSLKFLSLNLDMDEDHCLAIGACFSRPDLEIELDRCKIPIAGAGYLAIGLVRNQGPTKLDLCKLDNYVFANGLRGNSSLKSLTPHFSNRYNGDGNGQVLAIARALKENEGLVDLALWHDFTISNETWCAICDSLETHPTLEVLDLRFTGEMVTYAAPAPAVLKFRIQALLDLLRVNMLIHTIRLDPCYSDHELFRGAVLPYLETNQFRPRVRAIQTTLPQAYRSKVLGRALLAARTDPNSFWMLLSGNAEVVFPSTTATTTPAANLPTPTTATAVATANVSPPFVAAASVAATSSDATRAAGQKRKACP
jgi:hypothetical protein